MKNKQEELDKIKSQYIGEEDIDWKSITRKINFDPDNPFSLSRIDPDSKSNLDKILDGMFESKSDLELRNQFIKDLKRHSEKGKPIFTYRALKSALLELKFRSDELCNKVKMTKNEFEEYLQKTIDKIDDIVVEINTKRYKKAEELLSDEEGFEELKQLQIEYHKAIEVLAIESAVDDQKKLAKNKVDLLALLRKE